MKISAIAFVLVALAGCRPTDTSGGGGSPALCDCEPTDCAHPSGYDADGQCVMTPEPEGAACPYEGDIGACNSSGTCGPQLAYPCAYVGAPDPCNGDGRIAYCARTSTTPPPSAGCAPMPTDGSPDALPVWCCPHQG